MLAPLAAPFPRPDEQHGLGELVAAYYRAYGVGTPSDVAPTSAPPPPASSRQLPDDLVPVTVDGARSQAPAGVLDELRGADLGAAAGITRLLPPSDPLLQPRDRAVLTSDRDPAAGTVADPRLAGRGARRRRGGRQLADPAGRQVAHPDRRPRGARLTAAERDRLEDEAQLVGAVRGAARTTLVIP